MKRGLSVMLAVLGVVVATAPLSAQNFGGSASGLRVDWAVGRARGDAGVLRGSVYNTHTMRAENVQLRVERIDGAGPDAVRLVYVPGTIGPGGRAYFETPVSAPDAAYRVSIVSFDRAGCGNG